MHSKNSNARKPPKHIQTRTQNCKVKENYFLKPQNSSNKDQRSMQSCSKPKEFRSALKGLEVFPRGEKWETKKQGLMQHKKPPNQWKGSQKQTSKTLRRFWNQRDKSLKTYN